MNIKKTKITKIRIANSYVTHGNDECLVIWRGECEFQGDNVIVLGDYIENNRTQLRDQYLHLVYQLGQRKVLDQTIVEYLNIRPGFSIWWMSSIAEKCNFSKAPYIDNIIRLMAFDAYTRQFDLEEIILESSDPVLVEVFRDWCLAKKILFSSFSNGETKHTFKSLFMARIPHFLKGLAWLMIRLTKRWALKGQGIDRWRGSLNKLTFISYLFNLDLDNAHSGKFVSKYWGSLPEILDTKNKGSNWLHVYVEDGQFRSAKEAVTVLNRLNKGMAGQVHVTLDSFINIRVLFTVVSDWLNLRKRYFASRRALSECDPFEFNYWKFFEEHWAQSVIGHSALSNLLHLALFDEAMDSLPSQRLGVYLQENQPWEFAAIQSWKRFSHGKLIGTPHSTVRFWDLRYFFDTRSFDRLDTFRVPCPHKVAVNGPAAYQEYLSAGYDTNDLVEVEALRYAHLSVSANINKMPRSELTLLVLGDFSEFNNQLQLDLLEGAMRLLEGKITVVYKAHPSAPLDVVKYPMFKSNVTNKDLRVLLNQCDIVFTSSETSAGVEAYCIGLPVISVLNLNTLNLSPLMGYAGVDFITKPQHLADKLSTFNFDGPIQPNRNKYFWFDPKLSRWSVVLELSVM